jgi:hypothetical protein
MKFPARQNSVSGGVDRGEIGAIAQLGERYNGIVEVTGSIPVGSTNKTKSLARDG